MSTYPKQMVIEEPLQGFMQHCEVYCSADCCGVDAFEVHRALLLRKVADMHLAGLDGSTAFRTARKQATEMRQRFTLDGIQTVNDEVPFWTNVSSDLPAFWLPKEQVAEWETAFTEASRYGGLSGEDGKSTNHRPV